VSLALFWWSIRTARALDFAFSERAGSIVIKGPFSLVRHPFYVSYMAAWLGSSILFSSPILWITLFILGAFYYLSARREEAVFLRGSQAEQYLHYQRNVGMFLPRISRWKKSPTEP
jgi:protein-S-isoprenylcysteine O-methyltransferase Ste14